MLCKQLDRKAGSSIWCNFDPASNLNYLSELQNEKHDLPMISILAGTIMH
jgi:hypothetical protein